jgi:hypothetical protein
MNATNTANTTKLALWPFKRGTPYWNDQLKLVATLLNNLAVASFTAAIVLPIFKDQTLPNKTFWFGIILGVVCHLGGQVYLRGME